MEILIPIAVGLVVGGFAGLFASLRSIITWLISLSILSITLIPSKLAVQINADGFMLTVVGACIGFFGTIMAIHNLQYFDKTEQRLTLSDFIVWHKSPKPQTDPKSSDPTDPQ